MRRYLALAIILLTLMAGMASPVSSQANGQPVVTVSHRYSVNSYGYGILNETISFSNPGSSSVQIPAIQLGVPDIILSNAAGLRFVSSGQYTTTKTDQNGTTLFTIVLGEQSLSPHTSAVVKLESYVKNVLNITTSRTTTTAKLLVMTAPSINQHVDVLELALQLPSGTTLKASPTGFKTTTNSSGMFYERRITNVTSESSSAQYKDYTASGTGGFHPLTFFSVTRSLITSATGNPRISDTILVKNLASTTLSSLRLSLPSRNITKATVVASSSPPLVNPTDISLVRGSVDFATAPFPGGIQPGNNYSFTIVYDAPSKLVKVSGGAVSIVMPHTPPVDGVVGTFVIQSSLPAGIIGTNSTTVRLIDATPLDQGRTTYRYSLSLAWGAAQAVPVASVLFAVVFIGLLAYRQTPQEPEKEKEEDSGGERLLDATKAFEDKLSLIAESLDQLSSKQPGTLGRTDFEKMKNELDALRGRALQRLNEAKQAAGPGRYSDLLAQIHNAAREEDRAARDLINLYEQYQTKRMREDTFRKLHPNYRRRLNGAINHLSDLLNTAQKEAS